MKIDSTMSTMAATRVVDQKTHGRKYKWQEKLKQKKKQD